MTKTFILLSVCFSGWFVFGQSIFGIIEVTNDSTPAPEVVPQEDTTQPSIQVSDQPDTSTTVEQLEQTVSPSPAEVFSVEGQEQLEDVVFPFQPVQGYPSELQGIWTADPVEYQYSSPNDTRKLQFGTTQCDLYLVTNLGVSVYDYSPVARCDELGQLTTRLFLKQIEGDVAFGCVIVGFYP
eukprot:TRINITY_DN5996_c0_g1_i1.p1 TRINITY_DN5996_c0_g1~~TRINITY_DN5996_c0_g1_i1.p1  ORF type:complete len:182 (-),score=15.22 TRINITY_DN5996_c0_g1_i1:29-574(-)